jgi:hypothetical protein
MPAKTKCDPKTVQAIPDDQALLLAEANVNPRTGFATDYLNHFNEAIMLLELLADVPECLEDFFAWRPKTYDEHFAASTSKHHEVARAAYAGADPELREQFDALATSMNEILMATREVMRQDARDRGAHAIADLAVRWVKPLLFRARAVINGTDPEDPAQATGAPQTAVDALFSR